MSNHDNAHDEAIRREVDGDGGLGEILAQERLERDAAKLRSDLPEDVAATLRLFEAMRGHSPAVDPDCPDAIRAHRRELIARSNLDDLAVRVLETYLEALDWLRDGHPLIGKLDDLAIHARNARRLETLRPDHDDDAQRLTSLESTVRIAHTAAVTIVDELRTYGDDTSYSRDTIEEAALRIARMTDEILTGTPRTQETPDAD